MEGGAVNPPLARTSLEAHLYMDLRPCSCGNARFDRVSSVVQLPDGDLGSRYAGACAGCGTMREFVFRLPRHVDPAAADEIRYGNAEPSELLDAGEWLWVADRYAKAVPADPHRLPEPDRGQARARLATAAAALDEVLKFVPAGASDVPSTAIWSTQGRRVYGEEPGRFRAARLDAVRTVYRTTLRRFTEG
jgi:hypothetical protein